MVDAPAMYDVAVVGLGPTGATLANLLGEAGLSVLVLEKEAGIFPLPRAIHFDGEVLRIFQALGLRDAVLAGLGIALLPDFSAREAIGRGLVQELLPGWQPVDVFAENLYVIRPYTPRVSRAVETFSRYLKATFS